MLPLQEGINPRLFLPVPCWHASPGPTEPPTPPRPPGRITAEQPLLAMGTQQCPGSLSKRWYNNFHVIAKLQLGAWACLPSRVCPRGCLSLRCSGRPPCAPGQGSMSHEPQRRHLASLLRDGGGGTVLPVDSRLPKILLIIVLPPMSQVLHYQGSVTYTCKVQPLAHDKHPQNGSSDGCEWVSLST